MEGLEVLMLLAAYGLAFFVQNKLWRPKGLPALLEKLLSCIFCLGFWMGLLLYAVSLIVSGTEQGMALAVYETIVFGFASAAVCYGLDTLVQWYERE